MRHLSFGIESSSSSEEETWLRRFHVFESVGKLYRSMIEIPELIIIFYQIASDRETNEKNEIGPKAHSSFFWY